MDNTQQLRAQKKRIHISYVPAVALLILVFLAGMYFGSLDGRRVSRSIFAGTSSEQPQDVDFSTLWKAWNIIQEKYVPATTTDPVTEEDLVFGAVQGLTNALGDPYTVFLLPQESEIFNADIRGNFEGVGMEIGVRNGFLVVIAPLRGTPADSAGIKSGDRILEIDDEPTEGMTIDEAVGRIRGERGTEIVFTIQREEENELRTISVIRDVIEIPTIETVVDRSTDLRSDGIFTIRLFNFSAVSPGLFRQALREFVQSDSDKLILDLRGNPGGFLEAAVDIASWFLPAGEPVVSEDLGEGEDPRIHRSKGYNIFSDELRMVILIDKGSASASEILAGALREHGVATLIGESTFGKGSVQELVDVTRNTSLKVTIARWVTPDGNSISDGGLHPDIVVPVTPEDIEFNRDPQLERAVEFLRNQ